MAILLNLEPPPVSHSYGSSTKWVQGGGGAGGNRPHKRTVHYNSHAKRRSRIIKYFIFQYSGSVKNIGFICRTPIPHKRTYYV